jgi:hypothetical protein
MMNTYHSLVKIPSQRPESEKDVQCDFVHNLPPFLRGFDQFPGIGLSQKDGFPGTIPPPIDHQHTMVREVQVDALIVDFGWRSTIYCGFS